MYKSSSLKSCLWRGFYKRKETNFIKCQYFSESSWLIHITLVYIIIKIYFDMSLPVAIYLCTLNLSVNDVYTCRIDMSFCCLGVFGIIHLLNQ